MYYNMLNNNLNRIFLLITSLLLAFSANWVLGEEKHNVNGHPKYEHYYAEEHCGKSIFANGYAIRLSLMKPRRGYPRNFSCSVDVYGLYNGTLILSVRRLDIRRRPRCEYDRVTFKYDDYNKSYCGYGYHLDTNMASSRGGVPFTVQFQSSLNLMSNNRRTGYSVTLTSYRKSNGGGGSCNRDEFRCYRNRGCINRCLLCDYINNCGDHSDELCYYTPGIISAIVISSLIALGFILAFCYCACGICKKKSSSSSSSSSSTSSACNNRRRRRTTTTTTTMTRIYNADSNLESSSRHSWGQNDDGTVITNPKDIILTPPPYSSIIDKTTTAPPGYYDNPAFSQVNERRQAPPVYTENGTNNDKDTTTNNRNTTSTTNTNNNTNNNNNTGDSATTNLPSNSNNGREIAIIYNNNNNNNRGLTPIENNGTISINL